MMSIPWQILNIRPYKGVELFINIGVNHWYNTGEHLLKVHEQWVNNSDNEIYHIEEMGTLILE